MPRTAPTVWNSAVSQKPRPGISVKVYSSSAGAATAAPASATRAGAVRGMRSEIEFMRLLETPLTSPGLRPSKRPTR